MEAPKVQSNSLRDAANEVAHRLNSPPLLFGYGAILVVAIVALAVDAKLAPVAIVALAFISLAAWGVFEIVKIKRKTAGETVNFKSGDVG